MSDQRRDDGPEKPSRRSFLVGTAGVGIAGAGLAGAGYALAEGEEESRLRLSELRAQGVSDLELRVNGKRHQVSVPHQRTLLLTLREDLGLTGTKKGCNLGQCGACTVLLDGEPVYACMMLAVDAAGSTITTIEGLEKNGRLHRLQESFIREMGSQCGHCTSGMIMSGAALLKQNPAPTIDEAKFALSGNLCRCGNYPNEVAAVLAAAGGGSGEAFPIPQNAGLNKPFPGAKLSTPVRIVGAGDGREFEQLRADIPSVDAYEKATGRARYAGDLGFHPDDEMRKPLFAKVVRSPHAHAECLRIDDSRARRLEGYRGMITWKDVPEYQNDRHFLNKKARYVGDAVAAICADDQYTAQEVLDLLEIEWEPLPVYLDAEEVLASGTAAIHEGGPVAGFGGPQPADVPTFELKHGDVEQGMQEADQVIERRYVTPIHAHAPIEPHACTALWQGDSLTLWDSQQSVFHTRELLHDIFGLPPEKMRVESEYIGGGFGGKCTDSLGKTMYQAFAIALSKKTGKPVRYEYTLAELLIAEDTRNPFIFKLRIGVKNDGTITALDGDLIQPTGGYASSGPAVVSVAVEGIVNTYKLTNFHVRGYSVYNNAPVGGEFRGFGHPQAVYARERLIDEVAAALQMDPVELRRKNLLHSSDRLYLSVAQGIPLGNVAAEQCLTEGAKAIGWERRQPPETKSGRIRRGLGCRVSQEHSGRSDSDGLVWIDRDGKVHVPTGIGNLGNHAQTGIALLVAQTLGVPVEDAEVTWADTADTAWDFVTDASRAVHCNGKAFYNAAHDLIDRLTQTAAQEFGVAKDEVRFENGEATAGDRQLDLRGLVRAAAKRQDFKPYFNPETDVNPLLDETTGEVVKEPKMTLNPATERLARDLVEQGAMVGLGHYVWNPSVQAWGASFAEVEVDMETGVVSVLKLVGVHDVGRVIYRRGAEAQIHGGTVMGLGYAMTEEIPIDPNTHIPLKASLYEMRPPSVLDYPEITPILLEAPVEAGPYGAKGLGENPMFNAAAAVGNAIQNATGIAMNEIPYTWPRVLNAIRAAGKSV